MLINRKAKRIQYEGIHLICFHCWRYGHGADHCARKRKVDEGISDGDRGQNLRPKEGGEARKAGMPFTPIGEAATTSSKIRYEPWMVV